MSEAITFLLPPMLMCLILIGIHCFLGIQVLQRGIIFIDLSLAQVASLGSTLAILFHIEHHSHAAHFISFLATLIAAAYFAWVKFKQKNIAQEVVIAIVYAFSAAAVILVVNSMAHGSEHIKEVLIGKILWVTWQDVIKTAVIYAMVVLVFSICRRQIFSSQITPFWDFIFYALFGVVITSSVSLAGILLVFSFLIIPAQFSLLLTQRFRQQLFLGWVCGFILAILGMGISYQMDLPAGAVIVSCFTFFGILFFPFLKPNSN